LVRQLLIDPGRGQMLTAGDDKTVRIWALASGRLIRTLRVPAGPSNEGRIFAIALSADGRQLAAAGWTGWDWDRSASIYLFDPSTGEMTGRIEGLPSAVNTLAFTRDGRYLAAGLLDGKGLRVFRVGDLKAHREDTGYTRHLFWLDVAPDGRIVSSSLDGYLRVYDANIKLLRKARVQVGKEPALVVFSPDGARIAVGFHDVAAVEVYSSRDLRLLETRTPGDITGWLSLPSVGWSTEGLLIAGGERAPPHTNGLLIWSANASGARLIASGTERLTRVGGLPGGGFYYATEDPAIMLLTADGSPKLAIESRMLSFRGLKDRFRVSADGSMVGVSSTAPSNRTITFSLFDRLLSVNAPQGTSELRGSALSTTKLKVEGWEESREPTLNGRKLQLGAYERSRSMAIAPDEQSFVLGTEWAIHRFDNKGAHLWQSLLSAVAWSINVTGDGRSVVAGLSDGTIRWYRMEDGVEYLALFIHANGEDWIAWTPEGYYVSSNYGDQYVGWHLNRGKDKAPDFYRAVQFERILYRPDIVEETFRNRGKSSGTGTRSLSRFDISNLATIAPPRVSVGLGNSGTTGAIVAQLRIDVESTSPHAMQEVAVYRNGIPITPAKDRPLTGGDRNRFRRQVKVPLVGEDNEIRVEVWNGISLGLAETYAAGSKDIAATERGDLYVLAVGANRFTEIPSERGANLLYAGRDADVVVKTLSESGQHLFRNVYTKLLNDRQDVKPEKKNILAALDFITQAGANDTVVVFLASHGFSDAAGNYYFLPRDGKVEDLDNVILGRDMTGKAPSLLSWQEFFDVIRRTAGRRLLIVDTCEAKNISGTFDAHSLKKRSAASNFALMVAAQGDQKSQEYGEKRHGLFTYALLEGLKGAADKDKDQVVELEEAFAFTTPLVERLRDKSEPQTPDLIAPAFLKNMALSAAPRGQ
jgi:WD40 repeat protein